MGKLDILCVRDERHGALQVKLKGSLDIFSYLELKRTLEDQVKPASQDRVLIDLTEVPYIASSGWAILTNAAKQLRRDGGSLVIYGLCEEVKRIYENMGIAPLLKSALDHAQALETVGNN